MCVCVCVCVCVCANEKVCKYLTPLHQSKYPPPLQKYPIMNTKSVTLNFMWCAQSSDRKVRKEANQL